MVLISCIGWYSSVLHWKLLRYVGKFPCVIIWACWQQAAHLHAASGPAFTLAFCPRPGHPQRCLCWQPLCLCLLGPLGQCAQGQPPPMGFSAFLALTKAEFVDHVTESSESFEPFLKGKVNLDGENLFLSLVFWGALQWLLCQLRYIPRNMPKHSDYSCNFIIK